MSLTIESYQLKKESVESEFNLSLNFTKDSKINYILKYPSNPILDCQIINLNEKSINEIVVKLINIINEDEFGITTRIELIQFKNWIFKIVNMGTSMMNLE